ncbi:MAG: hypothetical protein WBV82_10740 [Myxococcaceae bacterium]
MAESKQEVLRQLSEAWKTAQAQLDQLRSAVERTGDLAQLKLKSEFLHRELDRAYRDLGEVVWAEVKKGSMELPASVTAAATAVEEVERRQAAQASSINDLVGEGVEVVEKSKRMLASRGKKS